MAAPIPIFEFAADTEAYTYLVEKWGADPSKWGCAGFPYTSPGSAIWPAGVLPALRKLAEISHKNLNYRKAAVKEIKKSVLRRMGNYGSTDNIARPEDIYAALAEVLCGLDFFSKESDASTPLPDANAQPISNITQPLHVTVHAEHVVQYLQNGTVNSEVGVNGDGILPELVKTEIDNLKKEVNDLKKGFKNSTEEVKNANKEIENLRHQVTCLDDIIFANYNPTPDWERAEEMSQEVDKLKKDLRMYEDAARDFTIREELFERENKALKNDVDKQDRDLTILHNFQNKVFRAQNRQHGERRQDLVIRLDEEMVEYFKQGEHSDNHAQH